MPQRQKEHRRAAIVAATLEELAKVGFAKATIPAIASRAGTSVGNVYKYFPSKDALYEAAASAEQIERFRQLFRARVAALGDELDVGELAQDHPYHQASEALLRYSFEQRNLALFLLDRAEGSKHEGFTEALALELTGLASSYAEKAYEGLDITQPRQRALTRIYRAFLGQIAAVLIEEREESEARRAIERLSTYHLHGLRAFFETEHRRSVANEGR